MGILQIVCGKQDAGTRKFYTTVPDEHIEDPSYQTATVAMNRDYFRVRLCEMFLKDKTNYISKCIPMTVALNMFGYGGRQCTVPVLVGNQMLSAIEKYVKNESIEFRNVPIIGPVPHTGEDFRLFIGLYRVAVGSVAKSLFGVINNLVGAFDLAHLSPYLGIAERIGDGLADLIGLDEVEMRLGTMDTFGSGTSTLRNRFLLCVNAPEHEVDAGRLWIRNGRLYTGDSMASSSSYSRHDYCLVNYQQEKANYAKITGLLGQGTPVVRGPDAGRENRPRPISAMASIQRMADLSEGIAGQAANREALLSVQLRLNQPAQNLMEIPHLTVRSDPADLDEATLADQVRTVKARQKVALTRPETLAEILSLASFQG
jgi:hypothetical protein